MQFAGEICISITPKWVTRPGLISDILQVLLNSSKCKVGMNLFIYICVCMYVCIDLKMCGSMSNNSIYKGEMGLSPI